MPERFIPSPHDSENDPNEEQMAWEAAMTQNRQGKPMIITQDQAGNWLDKLAKKNGARWDMERSQL